MQTGLHSDRHAESKANRYDGYFGLTLIFICALTIYVGFSAPLGSYGHDSFFFLDNAYRVMKGQIPYADFSSAFGPLIFQIHATGLALSKASPDGVGYANALWGASIAIWATMLALSRVSALMAYAIGIYTLCLIVAPFPLGNNPSDFGFAMTYNRYGYAILGIIVLECGDAYINQAPLNSRRGPLSTGLALGLLAFLKVTYFLTGAAFVLLSFISLNRKDALKRGLLVSCSFLLSSAVFLFNLKFSLSEMLEDLANAAASRRMTVSLLAPIQPVDLLPISFLLIFSLLVYGSAKRTGSSDCSKELRTILLVLSVIVAGYLTMVTNHQSGSFPLIGYAAVLIVDNYRTLKRRDDIKPLSRWFSDDFLQKLLLGVSIVPTCLLTVFSLVMASNLRLLNNQEMGGVIESPARRDRLLFAKTDLNTETTGYPYVAAIRDGLALLLRHLREGEGVIAFDEFNPFNYLLDRPPPRGGIAAAAYAYTFNETAHPSAKRFFGNTDYVMVRRYTNANDTWETLDVNALLLIYGNTLRSEFVLLEKTDHWELWRKRAPEKLAD